jgi:hypothetical protein
LSTNCGLLHMLKSPGNKTSVEHHGGFLTLHAVVGLYFYVHNTPARATLATVPHA